MRLSSQRIFFFGLILLVVSGLSIATSHQGFAGRLLIFVFYIFLLGIVKYLRETKGK